METLTLIVSLATGIWYVVDRIKLLWKDLSWGKWLTVAAALVISLGVAFSFQVDILYAAGYVDKISIIGQILAGIVMASGSSAASEVIDKLKR